MMASRSPAAAKQPTIAVLGTGIMGGAMAARLLDHGSPVVAWNRDRAKADALVPLGGRVAPTAADAVAAADLVVTMLADGPATEDVMGGALGRMAPGALWLQMATVGPDATAALAAMARGAGADFVDAPVLGTRRPAEEGKLTVLASGPGHLRPRAEPVFEVVGSRLFWLGEIGAGTRMKLVVNTWIAALVGGLAESIALAEAIDVDPAAFLDVVEGTAVGAPYVREKGTMMLDRSYPAQFPLRWLGKDVLLASGAAARQGLALRVAPAIGQLIEAALGSHADDDMSALVEAFRASAGQGSSRP